MSAKGRRALEVIRTACDLLDFSLTSDNFGPGDKVWQGLKFHQKGQSLAPCGAADRISHA